MQHCSFSLSTHSFGRVGRSFKRTVPPKANRYTRNNSTNTKIPPTGGGRWLSLPESDSAEGFFLLKVSFSFLSSPAYKGSSDCCGYLPNTVGYEGTLLLKCSHTQYRKPFTQTTETVSHKLLKCLHTLLKTKRISVEQEGEENKQPISIHN